MTDPTIAADVHKPLDIALDCAPKIALHAEGALNDIPQARYLIFGHVADASIRAHSRLREDPAAGRAPDAVDVR